MYFEGRFLLFPGIQSLSRLLQNWVEGFSDACLYEAENPFAGVQAGEWCMKPRAQN